MKNKEDTVLNNERTIAYVTCEKTVSDAVGSPNSAVNLTRDIEMHSKEGAI